MITIPYFEVFTPSEQELDYMNKRGNEVVKAGYKFYDGKWYHKVGMVGAPDGCAKESKERPFTLEEIKGWQVRTQDEPS